MRENRYSISEHQIGKSKRKQLNNAQTSGGTSRDHAFCQRISSRQDKQPLSRMPCKGQSKNTSVMDFTKLFPNDTKAEEYFVTLQQNSRRKCIQPGEHENFLKVFKTLIMKAGIPPSEKPLHTSQSWKTDLG